MTPELRGKDLAVLQAIHDGASDVTEIREFTTLTNREINYSLTEYSLEKLGVVDVHRPEGREWREYDGTKRRVWKPKQVELTDRGIQALNQTDQETRFEEMSKQELIIEVRELENRFDRLETVFREFREKVMERL